jgi:hypothetical protein
MGMPAQPTGAPGSGAYKRRTLVGVFYLLFGGGYVVGFHVESLIGVAPNFRMKVIIGIDG